MYKYLGHCINDELSDDDDMTRQRNKIYAKGNALIRKFYMCTENVKIALFKSYCTTLYTSTRAYISSSYVRKESTILSLSWWGWGSCYESVVLGAPFTPAGITAEAERRVAHSISCNITL